MTALTWVLLAFAVIGFLFGLWQWTARRKTVRRLDNMLEQSISGGFTEEHFDETELSALETKFVRFLRGSAHTQKTMETEQEAVKTLISDISHQTRTPIANLLVYASLLTESNLLPRQQEQAQALLTQGEKLSFLIQTLVKASRLETGIVVPTPSPGPVAPLLEAAAGLVQFDPSIKNKINTEAALEILQRVWGAPGRIFNSKEQKQAKDLSDAQLAQNQQILQAAPVISQSAKNIAQAQATEGNL